MLLQEIGKLVKFPGSPNLRKMVKMFQEINADCKKSGESVVPLKAKNADYYRDQCKSLEYTKEEITEFLDWLKTQK